MGPIVRGVAAVIGLARESYVNRDKSREVGKGSVETSIQEIQVSKDPTAHGNSEFEGADTLADKTATVKLGEDRAGSKRPGKVNNGDDVKTGWPDTGDTADEEALPIYGSWELDEAQDTVAESAPKVVQGKVVGSLTILPQSEIPQLAEKFAATYPLQNDTPTPRLDCSVIIPQRRPDSRKRGFIRAYAPVLAAKGISEEIFLDFISTFNVASQANPLLNAINLASFATLALPPGIGIAVAEAIRLVVDVGIEVQSRYRTNSFLDKINKLWFLPRGLVCFPMIWKPSVSSLITNVAMDNTAAEQSESLNVDKKAIDKFKGGASTSRGNVQFPDAAPLTFPILNDVADSTDQTNRTIKERLKRSVQSNNDYFDRRAQAKYAMLNPESGLSNLGVRPEFKSRYSDPSHPAASGSLLGLITGGAISTGNRRLLRRQNQKGGLTSLIAPDFVVGGNFFDKSGGNATAVADFMRDIKLTNVIRTMRGKVSDIIAFRHRHSPCSDLTTSVASTLSRHRRCTDSRGDSGGAATSP
jgi:hypothetical protein